MDSYGLIVNRVEITNPGTTVIVACEVLTKSSVLSKSTVGVVNQSESSFCEDLDSVIAKIQPFFGDQKVVLRLTYLDGLLLQENMQTLEKTLQNTLKNKKLGTGLVFLSADFIRIVCLCTQLPVGGLFMNTYLELVKKAPGHRSVFDYIETALQTAWKSSSDFRRLQGVAMQVKGR